MRHHEMTGEKGEARGMFWCARAENSWPVASYPRWSVWLDPRNVCSQFYWRAIHRSTADFSPMFGLVTKLNFMSPTAPFLKRKIEGLGCICWRPSHFCRQQWAVQAITRTFTHSVLKLQRQPPCSCFRFHLISLLSQCHRQFRYSYNPLPFYSINKSRHAFDSLPYLLSLRSRFLILSIRFSLSAAKKLHAIFEWTSHEVSDWSSSMGVLIPISRTAQYRFTVAHTMQSVRHVEFWCHCYRSDKKGEILTPFGIEQSPLETYLWAMFCRTSRASSNSTSQCLLIVIPGTPVPYKYDPLHPCERNV